MARSLSPDRKRSRHHRESERSSGRDDRHGSSRESKHDRHREERRADASDGRHSRSEERKKASSPDHRSRRTSSGARSEERRPHRRSPEDERRGRGREGEGGGDLGAEQRHVKIEAEPHGSGEESGRKEEAEGERRRGAEDRGHGSHGTEEEEEPANALVVAGDVEGEGGEGGELGSMAAMEAAQSTLEAKEKAKAAPSFGLSGKLAEETNRVRGVTLLFTEPPEARQPTVRWRLYVFKDGEPFGDPLYIHRQSSYLFGRERKIADVPTDHPSCSKQHAVLQYRLTEKEGKDFVMRSVVVPYIMDLGSTNGTYLNGKRMEAQRYYELLEQDTLKFGNSSREYVLLHEGSTT